MKSNMFVTKILITAAVSAGCCILFAGTVWAHCDTTGGPVIPEARAALEKNDVTPILKWIKKDNEAEIRIMFAKVVAVRGKGPEAQELADQYFLETFVRLHRAGEGAPYSGIKEEPAEPIVAMADKALAAGSADEMIKEISSHMAGAIKEKFTKVVESAKNKDKSVAAGRDFVEAYVTYMHYVEDIHTAITSSGGHHHEGAAENAMPATSEHKEHKD